MNPTSEFKNTSGYSIVLETRVQINISYKNPFPRCPQYCVFYSTALGTYSIQLQQVEVCTSVSLCHKCWSHTRSSEVWLRISRKNFCSSPSLVLFFHSHFLEELQLHVPAGSKRHTVEMFFIEYFKGPFRLHRWSFFTFHPLRVCEHWAKLWSVMWGTGTVDRSVSE